MKEEYQAPVLEELDSTLVVAGNTPGLSGEPGKDVDGGF